MTAQYRTPPFGMACHRRFVQHPSTSFDTPISAFSISMHPALNCNHAGDSVSMGWLMQVPCPPDDLDSPVSKKARADTGQWQQQQSKATANQQRQQAQQQQQQQAAAKRQSKDTNLVDMHQFWKYFHLVPAQVRSLSASLSVGLAVSLAHLMINMAYLVCPLCCAKHLSWRKSCP